MNIDDLTIGQARELARLFGCEKKDDYDRGLEVGKNYLVEIPLPDGWPSMYCGELVAYNQHHITLKNAAFVAETGRRHLFMAGIPDDGMDVEPYPETTLINLPASGAVVTSWPHALLRDPK